MMTPWDGVRCDVYHNKVDHTSILYVYNVSAPATVILSQKGTSQPVMAIGHACWTHPRSSQV
jgi:hypothetical protein